MANLTTFGPHETCTLELCDATRSVYQYRPSIAANSVFIALFGINMVLHLIQGFRWRSWFFMGACIWGCIAEVVGYGGRVLLWQNPFSFPGFMVQIVCLTLAPAFYSAAIYLTLSKIVVYLDPTISRVRPSFYYWIFIPCDILSLTLQATGGGMSSTSNGSSQVGVNIAIAGLSFQVFTLTVFTIMSIDYAVRYVRSRRSGKVDAKPLSRQFKNFIGFLSLSILTILVRCVYRIDELSQGYDGPLISDETLFIVLEGVMIVIAAFALNLAHPGPIFANTSTIHDVEVVQTKH